MNVREPIPSPWPSPEGTCESNRRLPFQTSTLSSASMQPLRLRGFTEAQRLSLVLQVITPIPNPSPFTPQMHPHPAPSTSPSVAAIIDAMGGDRTTHRRKGKGLSNRVS